MEHKDKLGRRDRFSLAERAGGKDDKAEREGRLKEKKQA